MPFLVIYYYSHFFQIKCQNSKLHIQKGQNKAAHVWYAKQEIKIKIFCNSKNQIKRMS